MKRHPQGMSLLEATIVLAVTGILTTLAVGAFGNVQEHGEVSGESHKLLVLLRNARTMALVTGVRQGVYIGGPRDAINNGKNGMPDLRNHMSPFRKPGIGSNSNDFEQGDIILERRIMPQASSARGAEPIPKLQLNHLRNHPEGSIRIVFDESGRPTVHLATSGSSELMPFPNNGTGPMFLVLRSMKGKSATNDDFNRDSTRRCVALEPGGEVRILQRDTCL